MVLHIQSCDSPIYQPMYTAVAQCNSAFQVYGQTWSDREMSLDERYTTANIQWQDISTRKSLSTAYSPCSSSDNSLLVATQLWASAASNMVWPSCTCPKTWYLGLTLSCISLKRSTHPARWWEEQRSPWPMGGPWVIRMSMPSGIFLHTFRQGSPRGRLNPHPPNSGCL